MRRAHLLTREHVPAAVSDRPPPPPRQTALQQNVVMTYSASSGFHTPDTGVEVDVDPVNLPCPIWPVPVPVVVGVALCVALGPATAPTVGGGACCL